MLSCELKSLNSKLITHNSTLCERGEQKVNILFQIVHFFYYLALSFFIAGSVCLGAIAAPAIFKGLSSRDKAGEIFGSILEKFDGILYVCMITLVATSLLRFYVFEKGDLNRFLLLRYGAIFLVIAAFLYSSTSISPRLRALRETIGSFDSVAENHPNRVEFNRLHKQSVCLGIFQFFFSLAALFVS